MTFFAHVSEFDYQQVGFYYSYYEDKKTKHDAPSRTVGLPLSKGLSNLMCWILRTGNFGCIRASAFFSEFENFSIYAKKNRCMDWKVLSE